MSLTGARQIDGQQGYFEQNNHASWCQPIEIKIALLEDDSEAYFKGDIPSVGYKYLLCPALRILTRELFRSGVSITICPPCHARI